MMHKEARIDLIIFLGEKIREEIRRLEGKK